MTKFVESMTIKKRIMTKLKKKLATEILKPRIKDAKKQCLEKMLKRLISLNF